MTDGRGPSKEELRYEFKYDARYDTTATLAQSPCNAKYHALQEAFVILLRGIVADHFINDTKEQGNDVDKLLDNYLRLPNERLTGTTQAEKKAAALAVFHEHLRLEFPYLRELIVETLRNYTEDKRQILKNKIARVVRNNKFPDVECASDGEVKTTIRHFKNIGIPINVLSVGANNLYREEGRSASQPASNVQITLLNVGYHYHFISIYEFLSESMKHMLDNTIVTTGTNGPHTISSEYRRQDIVLQQGRREGEPSRTIPWGTVFGQSNIAEWIFGQATATRVAEQKRRYQTQAVAAREQTRSTRDYMSTLGLHMSDEGDAHGDEPTPREAGQPQQSVWKGLKSQLKASNQAFIKQTASRHPPQLRPANHPQLRPAPLHLHQQSNEAEEWELRESRRQYQAEQQMKLQHTTFMEDLHRAKTQKHAAIRLANRTAALNMARPPNPTTGLQTSLSHMALQQPHSRTAGQTVRRGLPTQRPPQQPTGSLNSRRPAITAPIDRIGNARRQKKEDLLRQIRDLDSD